MKGFQYTHRMALTDGVLFITYDFTLDHETINPTVEPPVFGPVRIFLHATDEDEQEDFHDVFTPAQARDLAALLLVAADAAERGVA